MDLECTDMTQKPKLGHHNGIYTSEEQCENDADSLLKEPYLTARETYDEQLLTQLMTIPKEGYKKCSQQYKGC